MTWLRIPRRPSPIPSTTRRRGRPPEYGSPPLSGATQRALAIDPTMLEATMMIGGWVSWEMVHFISEVGREWNEE